MEIKYTFLILIGIVLVVLFWIGFIFIRSGKKEFKAGNRYGDLSILEQNNEYMMQKLIYSIATIMCAVSLSGAIVSACILGSRLYTTTKVNEEQYSRDIMLCLDISTSVDSLNMNLIDELKDTVKQLRGERMGIIIFNTSPVLIAPLTDDYEYILEQLDNIETSLKERIRYSSTGYWKDDTYEKHLYLEEGTLVGNAMRGSSLIGDGLASTVYNFSETESDRAKVVIFATDNDPYGESYFELPAAAQLCKDNKIIVYGIGTKEMTDANMNQMRDCMNLTGGKFFLEEESGTFSEIVSSIEKLSSGKVKGKSYVKETDMPKTPFIWLVVSLIFLFGSLRILRR